MFLYPSKQREENIRLISKELKAIKMFHVNYGDKELTEVTIFYGMYLPLKVYLTYLCHLVFNMVR